MKPVALAALLVSGPDGRRRRRRPSISAGLVPQAGGTASGRIVQLVGLLTVLSIAPGLLVMVTSFTRFAIAFSFLRSGLGLQTTPANLILISLSLFMTFYVMAPTFDRAWTQGSAAAAAESDLGGRRLRQDHRSRSASSCWPRCATRT